jgi:Capsule biosynthesis CapC
VNALLLPLFPTSGFDRSATTPVLLGVLISWFFTETLGWVFAGLVVPGYLAGVFVLDARVGAIDVAEGIATYGLARAIDELLPRAGLTFRSFGRERFLLVIVISVIVRLTVDAVFLRRVLPEAAWAFSIGLVVVPLMANSCWKTGLLRGIVQNGVPTALVYILLRFVLLRYTNLSLSGFQLASENVAASFLASPKAYILLIAGAAIAAATNVRFGWDFNGILIPALLALVIVEPTKLLATFAEAVVLLGAASLVLFLVRMTPLARANVEGPRRTVLFVTLDYALRFLFAVYAGRELSSNDVVQLMGFGYLLPTLLAVKMSEYGSIAQVLLPTLEVSGGAFVLATVLGFLASRFDWRPPPTIEAPNDVARAPSDPGAATLWCSALALPRASRHELDSRRSAGEFAATVMGLVSHPGAIDRAKRAGLSVAKLDRGILLVREPFGAMGERLGYPIVLAADEARSTEERVVAFMARPLAEPMIAAAAGKLLGEGFLDAVVLAGVDREPESEERGGYAHAAARALLGALRKQRGGKAVLVEVSENQGASVAHLGERAHASARIAALLTRLKGPWGEVMAVRDGEIDDEAVLGLSPRGLEGLVTGRGQQEVAVGSPTALAIALEPVRPFPGTPVSTAEDVLALRHLVLTPMLAGNDGGSPNLLRLSAAALGYELSGPAPLAGWSAEATDRGLLLVASRDPRPVAVFTRTGGPHKFTVEVEQGTHARLRDLGVRLASSLDADSVLLGLEPSSSPRETEGMRALHAAALAGKTEAIVVLREAPVEALGADVSLGSWADTAQGTASTSVKWALASLGWRSEERPLDQDLRALSARSLTHVRPMVFVTVPADKLETASLRTEREASELASEVGIPVLDGEVAQTVDDLAASVVAESGRQAVGPSLPRVATAAALEHSLAGYRALAVASHAGRIRAALVRSRAGVYLVTAARYGKRFYATATSPSGVPSDAKPTKTASVHHCGLTIAAGGACYVEER